MSTYTTEYPTEPRCEERRRPVRYLRIMLDRGTSFNGCLIQNTAKRWIRKLDQSVRSKYVRHIGAKQLAKKAA